MDYGKNSKFEKISSISFESVSSDQENFEIFQDYSEDIDFMETLQKPTGNATYPEIMQNHQ